MQDKIIKVVSTHPESQGPFVLMNESDFDKDKHTLYTEKAEKTAKTGGAEDKDAKKAEADKKAAEKQAKKDEAAAKNAAKEAAKKASK